MTYFLYINNCFSIAIYFVPFVTKKLMQSLEEAHKLLDRHVQSINKHCELEAVAHLELDETKTECHTLKESLEKEQQEKLSLEETLETRTAEWNDQVLYMRSERANTLVCSYHTHF